MIASLHWGTEGEATPTASQREVAEAVTASGEVDLIIGHHAHVLQPIEQINGVWVAFGLGNILSNLPVSDRWPASTQDAAIVEFPITVADDGFGGTVVEVAAPSVRPTWVDKDNGWVIRDVLAELRRSVDRRRVPQAPSGLAEQDVRNARRLRGAERSHSVTEPSSSRRSQGVPSRFAVR